MIIDAHQHFWKRDLPFDYDWLKAPQHAAINRDFLPEDLQPLLASRNIDYSVFVQTQHNLEEAEWVLELAEQFTFLAGVVGWVDLASDHCERDVERLAAMDKFVGIRHITQDEPDDDFIVRPNILNGLKVLEKYRLPFDLLFFAKHLKHAPSVAAHVPELPLVIDHLSKANIKGQEYSQWAKELEAAAAHENVHCKLSGMITEADWGNWKPADLKPFVEKAIESFGPERCMYGSDWPVCELAGSYQQAFDALAEIIGPLSEAEKEQIYCSTAVKFYGLNVG
ncbi:MAG: amidohydrolase family protein [Planctomycetota bacterium]